MQKTEHHSNEFSLITGFLCVAVVYRHSAWAGGFNISSLGMPWEAVSQIMNLVLFSIVPIFFICWGYLSHKYLYEPRPAGIFLIHKLVQFYPVFFITSLVNFAYHPPLWDAHWLTIAGAFTGVYYTPGFTGGNIFLVVLFTVGLMALFKQLKVRGKALLGWSLLCLGITQFLPHESSLCYIRYFGFFTAFWLGVTLKELSFFERQPHPACRPIFWFTAGIGTATPLLNASGIHSLEIQYFPDSVEQLAFSLLLLTLAMDLIRRWKLHRSPNAMVTFLHRVGNQAYNHFMIHAYVIRLMIEVGSLLALPPPATQLLIIAAASPITVFCIARPYAAWASRHISLPLLSRWGIPVETRSNEGPKVHV